MSVGGEGRAFRPEDVLRAAIKTVAARGATHGNFAEGLTLWGQLMQPVVGVPGAVPSYRAAAVGVMLKVSRILTGDPGKLDHWIDICGYAALAAALAEPATPIPDDELIALTGETQESIARWARSTFGVYADGGRATFKRLCGEFDELVAAMAAADLGSANDEAIADELADVAILTLQLAADRGLDLAALIDAKMAVNRRREWMRQPDGTFRHREPRPVAEGSA